VSELVAGIVRRLNALTDDEILELHREISRRATAIYAERSRDRYEAGVAAARSKTSGQAA
jgi:hypothetical protein